MARRRDPYLDQAQLEAGLQIDPQIQALAALLAGKRSDYINTRRVNASNARGIAEAANRGNLAVSAAYGGNPANPQGGSLLAALKGTADTPEEQAAYNRMAAEQAYSQAQMAGQAQQAEMGRQFSNLQARESYMGAKDEINSGYQDLLAQSGKLTAATYGKLVEARRERAAQRRGQDITADNAEASRQQSERNSVRASGIDPETGQPIPGGKLDPKGPKGVKKFKEAAPGVYQKATSQINEALAHAKTLAAEGASRAEVADALVKGIPNSKKNGKTIQGVPKIDQPYVTAALDVAFDEHLSRKTQQTLNQQGIRVKKLGLPTYGAWKKRQHGKTSGGPLNPAGNALDAINRILG